MIIDADDGLAETLLIEFGTQRTVKRPGVFEVRASSSHRNLLKCKRIIIIKDN